MTDKEMSIPFVGGGVALTSQRLQELNSQICSNALLREARRMSIQQQKEHAPLIAAFKAQQRARRGR